MTNELLNAALGYASEGKPVFPCDPRNKTPLVSNGFKNASTDESTIRNWWTCWPNAMIGVPTGGASGVWVLDVDSPAEFEAACPVSIPATQRCDTHKGYHLYFRYDPAQPVRNAQRSTKGWPIKTMPGAEVRGEGGYVIAPPSLHPEGTFYHWANDLQPAPSPADLLAAIDRGKAKSGIEPVTAVPPAAGCSSYGLAALNAECEAVRRAGNGEQESALNQAALKLGALVAGGELDRETARAELLAAGMAMPSYNSGDPWTLEAVEGKVERGLNDGARQPRKAPDPVAGLRGVAAAAPVDVEANDNDLAPLGGLDLQTLATRRAKPKQFAIEQLVPVGEVTLFTGAGSAGKSLLAQQFATAAAGSLHKCLGLDLREGPAIYLTCEDDAEQLHWRQQHLCEALGVPMAGLAGRLHLISRRGELDNPLGSYDAQGHLIPSPFFHRLRATVWATGAKLVLLDNVAHLFTGNENDRGEVTQFVNLLNRLAGDTGTAIVLLAHPNKAGADYSGSTAWQTAVRSHFVVHHDLETDLRTLTIPKANLARKGGSIRFVWQDWAFVCESDLPPDVARSLQSTAQAVNDNDLFLACLRQRTDEQRAVSDKPSATFAPKVFAGMPESKGIGRPRLEKAMDRLFRLRKIERAELWKGPDRKPVFGLREVREIHYAGDAGDYAATA
ncbi:bifunctional DNA primase/polymerase [Alteraurantiacibacter buctensis]|uniref:AAA family ATPase n=1 Tax=Alteraurantiacibacter buctensis TaxID=1503981 RepID=A0A844Z1P8_9SPHN|nr:bifunctional DNA primase/polymerase [Alteraurantiacibacter buctensis]MXO72377.1 AAA family ATPase [Alteraurantiacibacter buctensis]